MELLTESAAGDVVTSIVDAVKRNHCDLLIVGLRHHPGLMDRLVVHTRQSITERSPCSVLSVC